MCILWVVGAGWWQRFHQKKRRWEDRKMQPQNRTCSGTTSLVLLFWYQLNSELRAARKNTKHTDTDKQDDTYAYFLLAAALRTFWLRPFQKVYKTKRNAQKPPLHNFQRMAASKITQPYCNTALPFLNLKREPSGNSPQNPPSPAPHQQIPAPPRPGRAVPARPPRAPRGPAPAQGRRARGRPAAAAEEGARRHG